METVKEMRRICQTNRESTIYQFNWMDRNILRKLSIYIVALFLKLKITANMATLLDFGFVLVAGILFAFATPALWLTGIFFFFLYMLFDCVDGEIARYTMHKGKDNRPLGYGAILGGVVDWFTWPYLLACMSIGMFHVTGSIISIIFGFVAVIARIIYMDIGLMPYPFFHEKGMLSNMPGDGNASPESLVMRMGRVAFGAQGFIVAVAITIVIDAFAIPDTVPAIVSTRLLYIGAFAFAATIGIIIKLYGISKHGARIQRI